MGSTEEAIKSLEGKSLSRRTLLTAGAAASAGAVAGLALPSLAGTASAAGGSRMVIRVEQNHITLNVLPPPSATFFLTLGNITQVDGNPASGKFYCRGVFTNPGALGLPALFAGTPDAGGLDFVEQRFRIDGLGQIMGSGDEGNAPLAVLGGTGRFTGVTGTYTPDAGLPIPVGGGVTVFSFDLRRG